MKLLVSLLCDSVNQQEELLCLPSGSVWHCLLLRCLCLYLCVTKRSCTRVMWHCLLLWSVSVSVWNEESLHTCYVTLSATKVCVCVCVSPREVAHMLMWHCLLCVSMHVCVSVSVSVSAQWLSAVCGIVCTCVCVSLCLCVCVSPREVAAGRKQEALPSLQFASNLLLNAPPPSPANTSKPPPKCILNLRLIYISASKFFQSLPPILHFHCPLRKCVQAETESTQGKITFIPLQKTIQCNAMLHRVLYKTLHCKTHYA